MDKEKIVLVLFDLDGVLLDSKKNMQVSWKAVNRKYKLKINFSKYFENIGIPFFQILNKLKIKPKKNSFYKKIKLTYDKVSKKDTASLNLYKGSKIFLRKLKNKGILTCILTSKDAIRSKVFLKKFNIKVNKLITPETIKFPKPYPYAVNQLKRKYKIKHNHILFIGDTIYDYKCAKNAKVNYAHVNWGYGKNYKPKIKINNFLDLDKYFIF
tara:strand:+ start:620 stop:1255 length:636 start_codon:yes stop_codon:yes gene_type:complete